ncbi:MAG: zf-HC2 domain-containing protein [Acidobacteriaceae bacterium]
MAEHNQFGNKPDAALRCEDWEALLADALDGLLPEDKAVAFRAHSANCANCGDLLAHAGQGREWLGYLHSEPDVPSTLMGKILDRTVGPGSMPLPVVAAGQGAGAAAMALPWRRNFHEARLLMTVAMAFFSIALTLNLIGVKVSDLRLADLSPSTIGSTVSRQFYAARGSVVRYYDNLRFVYQLESRMRELRRTVETTPGAGQPQKKQEPSKQSGDKSGSLGSGPRGDVLNAGRRAATTLAPQPVEQRTAFRGPRRLRSILVTKAEAEATVFAGHSHCVSLDQPRTGQLRAGLQERNDRRSLV